MGTKGREIVGVDIKKLIESLNKALADEWLAYYQYWLGAKVAVGPMKSSVIAELTEHAGDELRHANMVADRILELGGTPVLNPEEWPKIANCKYEAPSDPYVLKLLEQNIAGEQCAIKVYKELLDFTKDKNPLTYQIALEILKDEVEHEDDLQALKEDMKDLK